MADDTTDVRLEVAEATRRALIEIARNAYEEAGLSGLCADGRWEVALGAMQRYNVQSIPPDPGMTSSQEMATEADVSE